MKRILVLISLFVITSLSCGLPFGGKSKSTETPSKTTSTSVSSSKTTSTTPKLGESYLSKEGGYSLKKIPGYSFAETSGAITMLEPNADPESGPNIFIAAGLNKTITTNEELMKQFKSTSTGIKITSEGSVTIKNVKGLTASISRTIGGKEVKGKIVMAMVTPFHQFIMTGNAPGDRWDKEVSDLFDAVLGSIEFTTPDISGGSPPTSPTLVRTATQVPRTNTPLPTSSTGEIRQWAKSAIASSQYSTNLWSASQATGAPNTEKCGDASTAWASLGTNTVEWIELTYERAVFPTEINILQSYNPSQVSKVEIIATGGEKYIIYEGKPEKVATCPDEYSFTLELTKKIYINKIRITVDQSVLKIGRVEIDAVELVGIPDPSSAVQPTQKPPVQNTPTLVPTTKPGGPTVPAKPGGALPPAQPGRINFQVVGSEEDATLLNATPFYKSTDKEYVINLWSSDKPSVMPTMFLLKGQPISPGEIKIKAYDQNAAANGPTFYLIVGIYWYYATQGTITIDSVEGDLISGKFSFTAGRRDNPSKVATVTGVFSKIQLK